MIAARADVVIVGAGPAGCAAAIALARSGRRVLVLEAARFPREKVCGGCLSGVGTAHLRALLGTDRPPPGVPNHRATFVIGRLRLVHEGSDCTWIAPRAALDEALADSARAAGALIRYEARATLELVSGAWVARVGDERIATPQILLGAGLGPLPQKIGIRGVRCGAALVAQQWVQPDFAPLPRLGEVELHWLRGGYVGLATPAPGECVIAFAARKSAVAGISVYEHLRQLNPRSELWQALPADAPRRHGAQGTAGFPWLPERLGDRNVLLIGDASGYAEPYTGEGIGQALRSGVSAAAAIIAGGDVVRQFTRLMRANRRTFQRARLVASILRLPPLLAAAEFLPFVPQWPFAWLVGHMHARCSNPIMGSELLTRARPIQV